MTHAVAKHSINTSSQAPSSTNHSAFTRPRLFSWLQPSNMCTFPDDFATLISYNGDSLDYGSQILSHCGIDTGPANSELNLNSSNISLDVVEMFWQDDNNPFLGTDIDFMQGKQFDEDHRLAADVTRLSLNEADQSKIRTGREQPKQIVFSLFKTRRYLSTSLNLLNWYRRCNQKPVIVGNNGHGRKGTLRCEPCRRRRHK